MTKEQVGEFVRDERKRQNLSQRELAEKAGLTRYQQIMEIETACVNYGIDTLIKVLHALGYTVEMKSQVKKSEVFDFSKVESIKPEPVKEIVGSFRKKPLTLHFKSK